MTDPKTMALAAIDAAFAFRVQHRAENAMETGDDSQFFKGLPDLFKAYLAMRAVAEKI